MLSKAYKLLPLWILLGFLFLHPSAAFAQYAVPQPPSVKILVNKMIFNPQSNSFVDNLSVNQFLFLPDQEVKFKVDIKNTGQKDLENVKVSDKLPNEVIFVSGPGQFDKNTNTLSFTIDKLAVDETKSYEIKAKIKGENEMSANVTCMSNLAEARVEGMVEQDTSSFCAQKKVLAVVKELPVTGPSALSLMLGVSLISSGAAIILSKRNFKGEVN